MDKKLLNKLVAEVSNKVHWADWEQNAEVSLEEFGELLVAAIDAERGKEAVAWFSAGFVTTELSKANQWLRNGYEVSPLFLSPTTPEGMALVPIEPTEQMRIDAGELELGED